MVDKFYLSTYPCAIQRKENGMALNIKNASVENLALELSQLTGESKTEAIRRALEKASTENRVRTAIQNGMGAQEAFRTFGVL